MARRQNKIQAKTFQQRQTEQRLRKDREDKDRTAVEDMAICFSCSDAVARDFADQCEARLVDLDFDLTCSKLALELWARPADAAHPVVNLLRELEAERERHMAALTQLSERLLDLTKNEPQHHHLPMPIVHYQEQVRDRLFPGLELRPIQNSALSDDR